MASKRAQKRQLNPMSLAFLDVMFCGFGAVILIFLILDHASTVADMESSPELAAEINLLREEVKEGQLGLVRLRNVFSDVSFDVVTAQGLSRRILEQIDTFLQELAALENSNVATVESVEKLRADIKALEEDVLRLQASALEHEGDNVRQFLGDGNRQYLSGLFLGGQRVLILVDNSASMLDDTLINIIRTRNRPDEFKQRALKWQRVVNTVDWISTQLPITSRYQVYTFNEEMKSAVTGSDGEWLEVADRDQLNQAIENVLKTVPEGGTNMESPFRFIANMSPLPDNIFLITDGLPTISDRGSSDGLITPNDRLELFEEAIEELPEGIPINIILMPLEGDPSAAAAFWQLAITSQGAFISPSKDWPGVGTAEDSTAQEDGSEDNATIASQQQTADRVTASEEISQDLGVSFPVSI